MTKNYVEVRKGKVRYFYVVRSAANGQVLSTSEKYWSKANAFRAARATGLTVRDGETRTVQRPEK